MGVTLLGVVWVLAEQPERRGPQTQPRPAIGIVYALLASFWQAIAYVLSKQGIGDYDAGAATYIRALGGIVGYLALITVVRRWPTIRTALQHRRAMTVMLGGALVGPYLGVVMYLIALRHCPAGVVATITSTTPVLILPVSFRLFRDRISLRALLGALLSVIGVALLVW